MEREKVESVEVKRHLTEKRSCGELLRSLPKRFVELLIKLISRKGVVLVLATGLLILTIIDQWVWFAVVGLFIGDSVGSKIIERMTIHS